MLVLKKPFKKQQKQQNNNTNFTLYWLDVCFSSWYFNWFVSGENRYFKWWVSCKLAIEIQNAMLDAKLSDAM